MNNNLLEGYIKIPNKWYDDYNITNEELTVLALLYRNYLHYQSISLCSVEILCDYMYINTGTNKRITKSILDTISSLYTKKFILNIFDLHFNSIVVDSITNKNYVFYVELSPPPENAFFVVMNNDLDRIFNYLQNSNLGKFNLVRYFIACRRSCSNEHNFGYLSQTKLKKLVSNAQTIQRYNKILQDELQLIRYNNDYFNSKNHYCTTFIGQYDNKDNFDKMVQMEVKFQGLIYTDKIKSNLNRSATQKLNNKKLDF